MCLECYLIKITWEHKVGEFDLDIRHSFMVLFLGFSLTSLSLESWKLIET